MAWGPRFALYGPSVLRARPPSLSCASSSCTLAPRSAQVIAAVSPATPPPMTVISFMAATVREHWPRVQFQVVAHRRGPVDLLLELDRGGDLPLHEQIERTLRAAIRDGRLEAGARLPSSRGLATALGLSRGVVTSAYDQLVAEGYLQTRQGAPVRVAAGVRAHPPQPRPPSLMARFAYEFSPGLPDLAGFPRDRWLRSLRSAWRETPLGAVGYGDPRGVSELREALADYLARVRGAAAEPEHLLVCTGYRQGLSLTCRWLRGNGIERVALEDPGWHAQRLIVEEAGLMVTPIPVDADGMDVCALSGSGADAVVVTSTHQFPTGVAYLCLGCASSARWCWWET